MLEVKTKPMNNQPILLGLSSTINQNLFAETVINLNDLKEDVYNFGPVSDLDDEDIVKLTYTVEPSDGNSYF